MDDHDPYLRARVYHEQNADFVEDIGLYRSLAEDRLIPGRPLRILELGSGTGRVSLGLMEALGDRGISCTGLDLSDTMVEFSQEQARILTAQGRPAPRFIRGDARSFDLGESFDLVIFPYNSFCHLLEPADVDACLEAVRRHLAPGGIFVPDLFMPPLQDFVRDPEALAPVDHFWSPSLQEDFEVFQSVAWDGLAQRQRITWYYQGDGDSEVWSVCYDLRVYFPQEFRWVMESRGWEVVEVLGDYRRQAAGAGSRALTWVCRPREGGGHGRP